MLMMNDALCSVCVTRHHEYVIYRSACVAVRERQSGQWLDDHHAVDERVALVPTAYRTEGLGPWDLEIRAFGLRVNVGPLVAVTKPDGQVQARLAQLLRHGTWFPGSAAIGLALREPG